jgi:hypothetical protein
MAPPLGQQQRQLAALLAYASAEPLGQRDDDALGAADVAEPVAVLVLLHPAIVVLDP